MIAGGRRHQTLAETQNSSTDSNSYEDVASQLSNILIKYGQ
jgi:hypothetical protein